MKAPILAAFAVAAFGIAFARTASARFGDLCATSQVGEGCFGDAGTCVSATCCAAADGGQCSGGGDAAADSAQGTSYACAMCAPPYGPSCAPGEVGHECADAAGLCVEVGQQTSTSEGGLAYVTYDICATDRDEGGIVNDDGGGNYDTDGGTEASSPSSDASTTGRPSGAPAGSDAGSTEGGVGANEAPSDSGQGGGCSVAAGGGAGLAGLLGVVAGLLHMRRRRR